MFNLSSLAFALSSPTFISACLIFQIRFGTKRDGPCIHIVKCEANTSCDLVWDPAGRDTVERAVTGSIEARHVIGAEGLDEGVVDGVGLGASQPGEGVDGTGLEVILGIFGNNAVELRSGDLGGEEVDTIEANAVRDPFAVDVLVGVDADSAVEGNAVIDAFKAGGGPDAGPVGLVVPDELQGAESTVDFEAIIPISSYGQYGAGRMINDRGYAIF